MSLNNPTFGSATFVATGLTPGRCPVIGVNGYLPNQLIDPTFVTSVVGANVISVAGRSGAVTLSTADLTDFTTVMAGYLTVGSNFDSRYYTKNQSDAIITALPTTLQLGTAATHDTGTTVGTIPLLDPAGKIAFAQLPTGTLINQIPLLLSGGRLPAVDGSLLTNLPGGSGGSTWREGSGAPSNGTGVNGDFYLDGATGNVYLRASGTYSIVCNIKGPTGTTGTTGSTGAAGSTWREGSGAPSNGTGIDGDFYLDGATGNVYLRSSGTYAIVCNIKGPTGTTGTAGTNGQGVPVGGTTGQVLKKNSGTDYDDSWISLLEPIKFSLNNNGSVLTTPATAKVVIPYNCTITNWSILLDQSGSVQFDVKRCTFSAYPTFVSLVGGGTSPAVTSAVKASSAPASWTSTALNAGDIVQFSLTSASTATTADLVLQLTRT
jgi:hypothetical protein